MGVTDGVSGKGNNYPIGNFWSKPSLQGAKTEKTSTSTPINMTFGNIDRKELGLVNLYNSFDVDTSGMKEIVSKSNELMAKLGYPNYKVTSKAVASVSKNVNEQTLPGLNLVDDNAVAARISTPKGPFAELFT